jgi:hypothetical protein
MVNGEPIDDVATLRDLVSSPAPKWTLTVDRDGRQFTVTLPG